MNILVNRPENFIRDCFVTKPNYIYVTSFNKDSLKDFTREFNEAEQRDQEIIPILINSPGGQVDILLAMISIIENSKKIVATVTESLAASCAAVLVSCGTPGFRYASPLSYIMVHQASGWADGKISEMETSLGFGKALNESIFKILDNKCGQKSGFWKKKLKEIDNAELFLDAKESLKLGLIDKIGIPNLVVDVKAKYRLE